MQKQREIGIDIPSDGEQSKPDYSTYIEHTSPASRGRRRRRWTSHATGLSSPTTPRATGRAAARRRSAGRPQRTDRLARLRGGTARHRQPQGRSGRRRGFHGSVSPGRRRASCATRHLLQERRGVPERPRRRAQGEYEAIADAGFILQLDCPDLGSGWNNSFRDLTLPQFKKRVDMHLEVLDEATKNIAPERMRLHLLLGQLQRPAQHDVPLAEIIDRS